MKKYIAIPLFLVAGTAFANAILTADVGNTGSGLQGFFGKDTQNINRNPTDAKSQVELGRCYSNGEGVGKNYFEVVKWFRRAAEQGHAAAQKELESKRDPLLEVSFPRNANPWW